MIIGKESGMVIDLFFPVKPSKKRVEIKKRKGIFLFSIIVSAPPSVVFPPCFDGNLERKQILPDFENI